MHSTNGHFIGRVKCIYRFTVNLKPFNIGEHNGRYQLHETRLGQ